MADRLDQLAQLNRLRLDGALTDEEFAAEKARILADAPAPAPDLVAPEAPRRWALWPAGLAAAAVVLIAAAWFALGLAKGGPDAPARAVAATALPAPLASPTPAPSPTAEPVALDDTLAFANPAQCTADGALEAIYAKLGRALEAKAGAQTVTLDAFPAPLAVTAKRGADADGAAIGDASVRFADRTYWHSLRLSRVAVHTYSPPETDGSYTRKLVFADPVAKVLRTLNRLGFATQAAPAYSELQDDACGGSMQVAAVPGGSALTCGWGC